MGPQFFQTYMGRKFYEHDVPAIATQLKRIADALEKLNKPQERVEKEQRDQETMERMITGVDNDCE